MSFKVGDKVNKVSGYKFPGTVVAVFKKLNGEERYVVEMDGYGLLHIFNAGQLEKRSVPFGGYLRKGQSIFNFLEWLRMEKGRDGDQSSRMADPFFIEDNTWEALWKEWESLR